MDNLKFEIWKKKIGNLCGNGWKFWKKWKSGEKLKLGKIVNWKMWKSGKIWKFVWERLEILKKKMEIWGKIET